MTKVLMYGCNGYMGHVICDLIKDMDNVEVAAGVDVTAGKQEDFPVFTSLDEVNVPVDAIIDFSAAPAVDAVSGSYPARKKVSLSVLPPAKQVCMYSSGNIMAISSVTGCLCRLKIRRL